MPMFSEKDINDAKKRVRDMQNRASHYVGEDTSHKPETSSEPESNTQNREPVQTQTQAELPEEEDNNKSALVILALILILSKEGADNMLILALLYLLL